MVPPFPTEDNGWIYVSNSELPNQQGGVSAVRFNESGDVIDAYSILSATNRNCAGGVSPWGTWFTCEEIPNGLVYECDPKGEITATPLPKLGVFNHEAIAIDPVTLQMYLTEDRVDGCFYRFTPHAISEQRADYSMGTLEVAEISGTLNNSLIWHTISDPEAKFTETRFQVPVSSKFNGGEGIWYYSDLVFFATKGDNRIWRYDLT